MRLGLAQTEMKMVLVVRDFLVKRRKIRINQQVMMAGVCLLDPRGRDSRVPLSPMRTQNLPPGMTCPSAGQMM